MKPIVRSYLCEVNLGNSAPGAGQNINFQDYPQLRDIYITGICSFDRTQVTLSPSGKNIVPGLTGITLSLKDVFNMDMVYQYPTYDLQPSLTNGYYRDFIPFKLQLTKSYITILDPTGLSANESILFNIFYVPTKEYSKYSRIYER
ncbi:hypothetical protein EBZ38_12545 [bacterium]|nr:hypothetical protein [bacterium]